MLKLSNVIMATVATALAAMMAPVSGLASESVIAPGTACVAQGHTDFSYPAGTTRIDHTGTSAAQSFTCPIVHGDTSTSTLTHLGEVRVVDANSTQNFSCRIWAIARTGTSWDMGAAAASSGSSTTIQTITLDQNFGTEANSYKTLECSVPAVQGGERSRIYGYFIQWS